jgi:hypothetical protein
MIGAGKKDKIFLCYNMLMIWEEWKSIQHSMSIEDFHVSDAELKVIAQDYDAQGYST